MPRHPQLLEIGKVVRKAREARGWSQDEFANDLGIARSYYGGVERGERNLSLLKLLEIAVALEIEPANLFPSIQALKKLALKKAPGRRSTT